MTNRRFFVSLFCLFITSLLFRAPLISAESKASDTGKRILFIGNSYTGQNNLPNVFRDVVKSAGLPEPTISSSTPGGRTLLKHLEHKATIALIDQGKWDVVVIQGQSQEAAMAVEGFLQGAQDLSKRIRATSPKCSIVWYQTWARHADYWEKDVADLNMGKDPIEMMARNRDSYDKAAKSVPNSLVAPVGNAWELHYQSKFDLRLHAKDNSHPTFPGTYLAALVIYGRAYSTKKLSLDYGGNLTNEQRQHLQTIAGRALP